jgi:hypothetical protein
MSLVHETPASPAIPVPLPPADGLPPTAPGPLQAGVGVALFVVLVIAFHGLSHWLGLTEPWVAFLWLLCWAGIDEHRPQRWLPNLLGAACGILIGWILRWSPAEFAPAGALIGLPLALLALGRTFMKGPHGLLANNTLWIFFTVITVPSLHLALDFRQAFASLAAGVGFFTAVLMGVPWLVAKWRGRPARA